jgi:enoyl-[acyl-carrier protein] reductase I
MNLNQRSTLFEPIFKEKISVIFGIANKESIAFSIANALYQSKSKLIIVYQERIEELVKKTCKKFNNVEFIPCDVTDENQLDNLFKIIKKKYNKIDHIVHSIAFAKKEDLEHQFIETKSHNFALAQQVSAYSLVEISRRALPFMKKTSSIITMSFQGSERVFKNYNVMGVCKATLEANVKYLAKDLGERGIRINAISAGPIPTRAALAIKEFSSMLETWENQSLLKRNVSQEEVAQTALFLLSELASGITGDVIHVDAGFHNVGYQ